MPDASLLRVDAKRAVPGAAQDFPTSLRAGLHGHRILAAFLDSKKPRRIRRLID
jgi:hypothetical protein